MASHIPSPVSSPLLFLDIETTGLYPDKHRITSIGIMEESGTSHIFSNQDERLLLAEFITTIDNLDSLISKPTLVTFNGKSFDIPFLKSRMQRYDMQLSMEKISSLPNIDLYEIRKAETTKESEEHTERTGKKAFFKPCSLDSACHDYGIYIPKDVCSEHVARLFRNEKVAWNNLENTGALILHNTIDLYALASLYKRMKEYGAF